MNEQQTTRRRMHRVSNTHWDREHRHGFQETRIMLADMIVRLLDIKPDRLTSYGITLQQVFAALEKNSANASGNFIEHGSEQYIVRGLGLVKDTKDIGNIIVATHEHAPVFVRDVADVVKAALHPLPNPPLTTEL